MRCFTPGAWRSIANAMSQSLSRSAPFHVPDKFSCRHGKVPLASLLSFFPSPCSLCHRTCRRHLLEAHLACSYTKSIERYGSRLTHLQYICGPLKAAMQRQDIWQAATFSLATSGPTT